MPLVFVWEMDMKRLVILSLATLASAMAFGQNLVSNPNFSAGTAGTFVNVVPPSWSVSTASSGSLYYYDTTGGPNAGDGFFAFGGTGNIDDVVFQTINTVAGQSYTYSMMLSGGGTPEDVNVYWNTSTFSGTGNVFSGTNLGTDHGFSTMSWTVTATGSSTVIAIGGYNSPSYSDLSEVSVTANSTPEPASFALIGLGAFALIRRRRR
jgi:MYXO-CTERM domain-containing protein